MSFFCAISGEPPQNPVVSPKTGLVYERRLIVAHLNQHGTEPSGDALNEDDLIPVKASPNAAPPRPPTLTSIPALLHTLQSEWDSLMLETASLRSQYLATRQELAHALYQGDAATRVVARLVRERDEAREALANVRAATGMTSAEPATEDGDVEMSQSAAPLEPEALPEDVQSAIDSAHASLSAARKKRKALPVPSPARLSNEPSTTFAAPGGTAFALLPSLSATAFVTGAEDGAVRVWDGGEILATLEGHKGPVTALESATTAAGEAYILSGSSDRSVRLWQGTAPYTLLAEETVHTGTITGLALHPSGSVLLTASEDGSFALLRLPSLALVSRSMPPSATAAHAGGYASLALHPDGVLLALGLASAGKIQIFDIRTRALAAEFDLPSGSSVPSLSFSENGYSLASCSAGSSEVVIWDLRKLVVQRTLAASTPVRSVAYDPQGVFVAAAGEGAVEAWAHKGWAKAWEGLVAEEGKVRWGAGGESVWVGGKSGVAEWAPEQ
ncbi:WD40 repeat-like protein [Calocera cornea HHB12733]|uniref:Pre-mRNA-processing factor 19 n=1 Tax=Calocera cornea HHB12733 TaxID=1353952 RepID=A0A165GM64_9BASI|nr:WD40 repeat-like protein [Calocera cornea HHB12733]